MYEFKKVDVWSLAKIYALIGVFVGLIAGIMFAVASSLLNSFAYSTQGVYTSMLGSLSWLSIIIFPILYGIGGLVGGAISALVYNGASKIGGGVMFDVVEIEEGKPAQ